MVKAGVYAVDPEKDAGKDLKKDDLKKEPLDTLPFVGVVKIVPETVITPVPKSCCTLRRALLLLLALFLVFLAVGAGVLAYKLLAHKGDHDGHKKSKFDCEILYDEDDPQNGKLEGEPPAENVPLPDVEPHPEPEEPHPPPPVRPTRPVPVTKERVPDTTQSTGSLDEEIEIDEDDETELFEIPGGNGCERVTIMHDFAMGVSAYKLWDSERCFVKPLELDCMSPWMLAMQMANPDYLRQHFAMVRENYLAVPPAIDDVNVLGPFVGELCSDVLTYWLEEITELMAEESVMDDYMNDWQYPNQPPPPRPNGDHDGGHDGWWDQHRGRREAAKGDIMKETKIRYWDSNQKVKEMKIRYKLED